MTMIKLKAT